MWRQQRRHDSVVKELASVDLEQRKLFLPKDIDPKEMSTDDYLRHLKKLPRRGKLKVTWYQTLHITYLKAFVARARKALDTADSLKAAARSTTLP